MARSWLPIGSVVTLKDGVRPVMVVAVMAQDSKTGDGGITWVIPTLRGWEVRRLIISSTLR